MDLFVLQQRTLFVAVGDHRRGLQREATQITLLDKVSVALKNRGSRLTCQVCLALFVWLSWLTLAD